MNGRRWLVLMTAAGLLATSAAAGANGLVEKVSGLVRNDITVTIDGAETAIRPVYIDGKAYLPARDTAGALGYGIEWNGKRLELQGKQAEEEADDYLLTSGVIASVERLDGQYRLEVLGRGRNNWIMLYVDQETVLTDANGEPASADRLKPGVQIAAAYGPIVAMSYPGQSHAAKIELGSERLIREDAVLAVEQTGDGWQLRFGKRNDDGTEAVELTLVAGKETMLVNREGQPLDWSELRAGAHVRAYYGPVMTKSMPPQSAAHVVVALDGAPDAAAVEVYREAAWSFVPDSEKPSLTTPKDEAQVEEIRARGAAIVPADDERKALLERMQAEDGRLIAVTYRTEQDALLGPLTVAIHPDTKELIGFFIRM